MEYRATRRREGRGKGKNEREGEGEVPRFFSMTSPSIHTEDVLPMAMNLYCKAQSNRRKKFTIFDTLHAVNEITEFYQLTKS